MTARTDPDPSAPLRAAVRLGGAGAVVLAVVSCVVGYLVRGTPGLWGALVGSAIAVGFVLFTAGSVLFTARLEPAMSGVVLLGGWLVKLLLLIAVLAVLRGLGFYDRTTLVVVVVVAAVGVLGLETAAVVRTRVPYVDPEPSVPPRA
jgi:hypothetical protein